MVNVTITLEYKYHLWYVLGCDMEGSEGISPLTLPAPSPRKFLSQEAAINRVKRTVSARIQQQGHDAKGIEIAWHVKVHTAG